MFYGDLSLPAKAAPSNQLPVIDTLIADKAIGVSPLTVNFTVMANDLDGSIAAYEWFVNGFNEGNVGPAYSGLTTHCTHTFLTPHRYSAEVQAVDNYKARAWKTVEIVVNPAPGQPMRVNCGACDYNLWGDPGWFFVPGADYTDSFGNIWLHDQRFSEGTWGWSSSDGPEVNLSEVAGTVDQTLYQCYRYGMGEEATGITYRIPVSNGGYLLKLGFADMRSGNTGETIMDVDVEGVTQVTGLDVFARVGGKTVLTIPLPVDVADGDLTFTLRENSSSSNTPFLNCFEIIPDGTRTEDPVSGAFVEGLTASPNPFNPVLSIVVRYQSGNTVTSATQDNTLRIYNVRGNLVRSLSPSEVLHTGASGVTCCYTWNAGAEASGAYFVRADVGGKKVFSKKAVLLK